MTGRRRPGAGDSARGDMNVRADSPAGDAPAGDAPAGDAPAGDAPAGDPPAGDPPAGRGTPAPSSARRGIDVARGALAAAKAEAKRRGLSTGSAGGGRRTSAADSGERRRWRAPDESRSGAHPDERDPQTFDASLGRLVVERGWETDAKVGGVMGRWAAVVGPELASHCEPVSFEDGELVVAASSTAWATQLRLLAPTLARRLCEEVGEGLVTRVTVQGPRPPSWKRGPLTVRGRGPRDTYG